MTTGEGTASTKPLRELLPCELRAAFIEWYPFTSGERALYLGEDAEAHVPVLQRHFVHVACGSWDAGPYDLICIPDWRGSQGQLRSLLGRCADSLAPDGTLLLGFRNRVGLKYLCGGIDEAVAEPFSSLACGDASGLLARGEVEHALDCSPFAHTRFHAVMPDAGFTQAVLGDGYPAKAGIEDRVFPYDPHASPFVVPESSLYHMAVREGLLSRLANCFLVECSLVSRDVRSVEFAALSADRGERHAFCTTLFDDGTALKRPLHAQGWESLRSLYAHGEELRARGVQVVEQHLAGEGMSMPVMENTPLLAYLAELLKAGREQFLDVLRRLRTDVMRSSDVVAISDDEAQRAWGVPACELGPVLERGFIDMIPLNAFWSERGIVYYDQEFAVEHCPVAYIMFRALRYTWLHVPEAERAVPLEEAKREFGVDGLWDVFMRRENRFVGKNRNWKRYEEIYRWARVSDDDCASRRRLIAQLQVPEDDGKPFGVGLLMGVFDLFHVGHLRLIQRAKEECAYLRVAVLSDDLVVEFKGKAPVIPLAERMEILAAIAEVDEVVAIEDNPSRIMEWRRRPFDCFFSGDDYEGNEYWEYERGELRKLGAEVRFFPYTQQQSSTKIRAKIS